MQLQEAKIRAVDFPNQPQVYDWEFDSELIEQSITAQYGILPYAQGCIRYKDWAMLVAGLSTQTPLGQTVAVRMEQDKEIIRRFSPQQKKVRAEWQNFLAARAFGSDDAKKNLQNLQMAFKQMYGTGGVASAGQ